MNNDKTENETGFFKKAVGLFTTCGNDKKPFTAEMAWITTNYGSGTYKPIEERICAKVKSIKKLIESRAKGSMCSEETIPPSFYCTVDIPEDLQYNVDDIFEPFKSNGFTVINLSEVVSALRDDRVYLISWKDAFQINDKRKVIVEIDKEQ